MSLVFRTLPDATENVEIVGAGVVSAGGKGGVPVQDAAAVMTELQEKNPDGSLKLDDDGNAIPLTGSKLTAAAKAFANARGLTTDNVTEETLTALPQEAGATADRPPAAQVAAEEFARTFGDGLEPVNDDPEELVNPGPGAGVPVAPSTPDTEDR